MSKNVADLNEMYVGCVMYEVLYVDKMDKSDLKFSSFQRLLVWTPPILNAIRICEAVSDACVFILCK